MTGAEHATIDEIETILTEKGDGDLIPLLPTTDQPRQDLLPLLSQDEGQHLEKKETFSYDTRKGGREKDLEHACIKTVAGMLNAEGGTLLIGVSDAGEALGVGDDLRILNKDLDRYELHIRSILTKNLGDATVAKLLAIRFHQMAGKEICEVRVDRGPEPTYIPDKGGTLTLFVRSGNQTKALAVNDAVSYVAMHFGGTRYSREILEGSNQASDEE